jgi:hypothetical protein
MESAALTAEYRYTMSKQSGRTTWERQDNMRKLSGQMTPEMAAAAAAAKECRYSTSKQPGRTTAAAGAEAAG